jgi:GT2 family glycosyltransferase
MAVVPSAELWHKASLSSGGETSSKVRYFKACSSGYYFRKHMEVRNFLFILLYRFGSAIKWTFFMAKKKDWTKLNAYWHGLFDGWILRNCSTQKIN